VKSTLSQKEEDVLRKTQKIFAIKNKASTLHFSDRDTKSGLIQTSFWMPESDHARIEDLQVAMIQNPETAPCQDMICPADAKHTIKVKKLYPLKLEKVDGSFNCFACKKKLMFQKIKGLLTCGHVMCADCVDRYCQEGEGERKHCVCGERWKEGDCVGLSESGSSYTLHNETEVKKYTYAFAI
jgi:hypothetical protein